MCMKVDAHLRGDCAMSKVYRDIIRIDEARCNGCGLCVPACKEGALEIVDGKARLVSEVYCDGLGACLGECPQGAISIEKREVDSFDEEAAEIHVRAETGAREDKLGGAKLPCGCPGAMAKSMAPKPALCADAEELPSQLSNWPVKLALVPANAPYLSGANLVLLADCTAVACANLHGGFVVGNVVAMACPKLDDREAHVAKLAALISQGGPSSIEVVMMEVPCCSGLFAMAQEAARLAGGDVEIRKRVLSVEGAVIERE